MLRKLTILSGLLALTMLVVVIYSSLTIAPAVDGPRLHTDQLPPPFDPNMANKPLGPEKSESWGTRIQRTNALGQLTEEFYFKHLEPRREGEFDATGPMARFYLAANRVLIMRSDRGYFIAPGNRPRRGRFTGHLVISVYETPPGRSPDLAPDSPDITFQALLDDADFDVTLGKIESAGPVRVIAPAASPHAVEFAGRGMVMVYNEPAQRIDFLQITEGQYLKYHRRSTPPGQPAEPLAQTTRPDQADAAIPDSPQYYHVTFDKQVRVNSDRQFIHADAMEVVFGFNRHHADRPATATPPTVTATTTDPATGQQANIIQLGSSDVTMTWAGKMIMKPLETRPQALTSVRDAAITFTGKPIQVRTRDRQTLECARLLYHHADQAVTATGQAGYPVRLTDPGSGYATAESLVIQLDAHRARLNGAGQLRSTAPADRPDARPGFAVQWSDHMTLAYSQPEGGQPRLQRAQFFGGVRIDDPQFTVNADQLDTAFAWHPKHQTQLQQVEARGRVAVRAERGTIQTDHLLITTRADRQGKLQPYQVSATGHVALADPTQQINAGQLIATLATTAAETRRPHPNDRLKLNSRVQRLWAADNVAVRLNHAKTLINADTLDADANERSALLTGSPVAIRQGDSRLQVLSLHVLNDGRVATAKGGGEFHYVEKNAPDKMGQSVTVRWTDRMEYRDTLNRITVTGNVHATSIDKPTEVNELSAGRVTLELVDEQIAQAIESPGRPAELARTKKTSPKTHRVLKQLTAENNVILLATRYTDAQQHNVESRLRMAGPILTFNNASEHARINGPGSLLIEDYRPEPQPKTDTAVSVSGRGATLFTWQGTMDLSGADTSFALNRQVRMTHKPQTGKNLIELQCGKLYAAMKGIGGIKALRATENKNLDIDFFNAEQDVQLRDANRMISCHQLRYEGKTQIVRLDALPNRTVEIVRFNQPKPFRAESIFWNLATDRLEINRGQY